MLNQLESRQTRWPFIRQALRFGACAVVLTAGLVVAPAGVRAQVAAQAAAQAPAQSPVQDAAPTPRFGGKLLLTGGVSQVEGAAGGGLATWAVIAGYGARDQIGANAHVTYLRTGDFALTSPGVAIGWSDRVELSFARQSFDTRSAGARLGLGQGYRFDQDIVGLKVRVAGDAVLDQDTWLPQIAVGLQYKRNDRGDVLRAIGARSDSGTDVYVAATKLLLAQSLLLNGTVRLTKANQFGLLGFGGDLSDRYRPQFEGSVAYLLSRSVAVGAEYRTKPNNLGFAREQNAYDVFVAWAPLKYVSLTLAYVQLGDIATIRDQHGLYGSVQVGF